jgi:hypothetical protein
MKNPFKYGETVSGEYFADRKKEMRDIVECIKASQNMFIYSYRRLGKTSLIKNVLSLIKDETIPIYIDLERSPTISHFVKSYSTAISGYFLDTKERLKEITSFFKRVIPSFEFTGEGWKVSFDFSRTTTGMDKALDEVIEIPQKVAERYKRRVVVVFDEFQEIEQYNGKVFEKKLRASIQHHNDVCYIFIGSKTHIILNMFTNPDRAFFRSAMVYPLDFIPDDELVEFILRRFASTGKSISESLARKIVHFSNRSPYHIQLLCFHIWLVSGKKIDETKIDKALDEVLSAQNELYYSWYDSLSMYQKAVLLALSKEREIFSQDAILTYGLKNASTTQASVKALLRNNLIIKTKEGYAIFDPFFKIWLRGVGRKA